MQPQSRVRRKNGRKSAHRHTEHQLPRRMSARELIEEAEAILARQAWITRPEANMLGVLLIGMEGVEVITLSDNELDYPDAIPGEAEVLDETIVKLDSAMVKEGHNWLLDCFEDCPEVLSPTEVVNAVNRYYSGGWQGFIQDGIGR